MNGSSSPCANRENTNISKLAARAAAKVGINTKTAAQRINILRPNRSEIAPLTGAMQAVAIDGAVTLSPVFAWLTWNAAASTGKTAWVHHRFTKVRNPAAKTARSTVHPVLEIALVDSDDIAGLRQCKKWGAIGRGRAACIACDPYVALHRPVGEPSGDGYRGQDSHVRTEWILPRRIDLAQNIEGPVGRNLDRDARFQ